MKLISTLGFMGIKVQLTETHMNYETITVEQSVLTLWIQ